MNICYLLGGFVGNGGIGRVTSILANKLSLLPENKIFTLSFWKQNEENLYSLNENIQQNYLFTYPLSMKKAMIKGAVRKLERYLYENEIDIVIACGALYYPLTVLACKKSKRKAICWEHSHVQNKRDYHFQSLCRKIGVRKADLIVTLTKADEYEYIKKFRIKNIMQIYNPIENKVFAYTQKYNADTYKIITVGRLTYQKNLFLLLNIAKNVLERRNTWEWHIYGEGEDRYELQKKINELGLTKKVILKGQVNNIYSLYSQYSFMVMTSRYEGFPMSLLEGLANGLPLISFDILTGPSEIIAEKENGFLIKPFSIEKMVEAIIYLIDHPQQRIAMSSLALKKSENFKLDNIVKQWEDLFDKLYDIKAKCN